MVYYQCCVRIGWATARLLRLQYGLLRRKLCALLGTRFKRWTIGKVSPYYLTGFKEKLSVSSVSLLTKATRNVNMSDSSDSDVAPLCPKRHGSRAFSRTFVHLDKRTRAMPNRNEFNRLRAAGRVKEIAFTKNHTATDMQQLLLFHFPSLVDLDLSRWVLFCAFPEEIYSGWLWSTAWAFIEKRLSRYTEYRRPGKRDSRKRLDATWRSCLHRRGFNMSGNKIAFFFFSWISLRFITSYDKGHAMSVVFRYIPNGVEIMAKFTQGPKQKVYMHWKGKDGPVIDCLAIDC